MNDKHSITAHLSNNVKTPYPNDFVAVVEYDGTFSLGEICGFVASDGESVFSAADLESCTALVLKKAFEMVLDGCVADLGLFSVKLNVKGAFYDENSKFDSKSHRLEVKFKPNKALLMKLNGVEVDVAGREERPCRIVWVENLRTNNVNGDLIPGDIIRLIGFGLKIAGTAGDVGVYFLGADDMKEFKLKEREIIISNKNDLLVKVPVELSWGYYYVKIVTQYDGDTDDVGTEIHMDVYGTLLSVSDPIW
jgi:hypothetical protein